MNFFIKTLLIFTIILFISGCNETKIKENNHNESKEEYSLISTTNRLVFSFNDKYEIVYYENNKIIKVETAIKLETEEEAKLKCQKESLNNNYSTNHRYIYNIFIQEETIDYWEDYKSLDQNELKIYMQNAGFTYID